MMLPIDRFSLPTAFNGRDGANGARGASVSRIEMEIWPASTRVNGVRNDEPDLFASAPS